ncbi:uncharacterized protein LOC128840792 [Malaclemys terrapin pileata]|uniref:uncharacterized protein LOC128840792 n=1 Tax=Malaclemys terrapin pileata TaxID=2991368 RepID=UPI0023A7AE22|nr:uncharacterized protein LOC128840792 [Malaclemys terrapin pileata]
MQSQNLKRAPVSSERETLYLIAVWGEESVQAELRCSRRNADIYAKITQGVMDRGYTRDTQQCCVKIKELRQAYQKTKEANDHSGLEPQTCRFYDQLHAILGEEPTATPPLSVDTCKGGASRSTDEDFVEEEEENAQQASGESVFPVSQDLFITLEPIPSQGELFPDLKTEKAPLMWPSGTPHAPPLSVFARQESAQDAEKKTCSGMYCIAPMQGKGNARSTGKPNSRTEKRIRSLRTLLSG